MQFIYGFLFFFLVVPVLLKIARMFGLYIIVRERRALVFTCFGEVIGVLDEPGMHVPLAQFGWKALILPFFGGVREVDLRLDQEYLRSQPVNSEEGAPMGIGIWYEMAVSDPEAYIYKNADAKGSLRANVSNAAVRSLSNMKLSDMLETRHQMSLAVRNEVSPKSKEWGYRLGSVYIRKVHFRDIGMIRQIEEKVVNRLRQVTSAIRQDGNNQVNIIKSTADRQASVEFARAGAQRPLIVGQAIKEISEDAQVMAALFEILEYQKLNESQGKVILIPPNSSALTSFIAGNRT